MVVYAGIYMAVDSRIRRGSVADAVGDAEALGVEPGELPQFLRGTPDGADALGAFAQLGLAKGDAHGDDFVVAAAWAARAGHGMDSTISSTVLRRRPDASSYR